MREVVTRVSHAAVKADGVCTGEIETGFLILLGIGPADTIEITHRARSRQGFAIGAVRALLALDKALKTGKVQKGKIYSLEDLE